MRKISVGQLDKYYLGNDLVSLIIVNEMKEEKKEKRVLLKQLVCSSRCSENIEACSMELLDLFCSIF